MPTYGFIRETVEERFYERGGEEPLPPRRLPCPVCGEQFSDESALALHLGSAHPLTAPRLLIEGDVVVGERLLHRRLPREGLAVANASEILVAKNGGPHQAWSIEALTDTLSEAESVVLDISLRNHRAGDGAAALEQVRLRVDVLDAVAMDAADRCFDVALASEELQEHRLDEFVDAAAESPGAARYASALHDYGAAILIKDQARGIGDSLPFASHREKLQRSLSVLRYFAERPVARAVCGFVRFGLNDFAGGTRTSGATELDRCNAVLQDLAGASPQRVTAAGSSAEVGRCPTDHTTSFILELWDEAGSVQELTERATRGSTTPEDAAKCRALALRLCPRTSEHAAELARGLMNDPVFGPWATGIVEDAVADG